MATGMQTCGDSGGVTKAGTPCRNTLDLSEGNGRCIHHDPYRKLEAAALVSMGGRALAEKAKREKAALPDGVPRAPRTLEDAEKLASWISRAVLVGEIHPRVAEAATKAVRQFQLTIEKRVLQDRVKDLERELRRLRA